EERYRAEQELVLLRTVHPWIDAENPTECEISGVSDTGSLESLLEQGGPKTLDYVPVQCEVDGRQFSLNFSLYKNADGSIVWRDSATDLEVQDLADLRHKLDLAKAFPQQQTAAQQYARQLEAERSNAQQLKQEVMKLGDQLQEMKPQLMLAGA